MAIASKHCIRTIMRLLHRNVQALHNIFQRKTEVVLRISSQVCLGACCDRLCAFFCNRPHLLANGRFHRLTADFDKWHSPMPTGHGCSGARVSLRRVSPPQVPLSSNPGFLAPPRAEQCTPTMMMLYLYIHVSIIMAVGNTSAMLYNQSTYVLPGNC